MIDQVKNELSTMRNEMSMQRYLLWHEYVNSITRPIFVFRGFTEKQRRSDLKQRNEKIVSRIRRGDTYESIAKTFHISRQRVHQIFNYETL